MEKVFDKDQLSNLWKAREEDGKHKNGEVTIVGGSRLFHGAPILALKAVSRVVGMVYFCGYEEDKGIVEKMKSQLGSFIWVGKEDVDEYIAKSDAVLIGPGMMRYGREDGEKGDRIDGEGRESRELTKALLSKFEDKKWVIDGGSLQVLETRLIPKNALLTPNRKEFEMLFGEKVERDKEKMKLQVKKRAGEFECVIALKGSMTVVSDGVEVWIVEGGSVGLAKGGTGDVLAGLAVGFLAKNGPMMAGAAADWLVKRAGEELEKKRGEMFNADDVAEKVAEVWGSGG